jgi:hypothetical protein
MINQILNLITQILTWIQQNIESIIKLLRDNSESVTMIICFSCVAGVILVILATGGKAHILIDGDY